VALPAAIYWFLADEWHFVQNREFTTGTVVDQRLECAGYHCYQSTTIRFTTATGRVVAYEATNAYVRVGDAVTVYYDSTDPRRAKLNDGWHWPFILSMAMLVAFWLGLIVYFIEQRRDSRPGRLRYTTVEGRVVRAEGAVKGGRDPGYPSPRDR
jgi:Protein of unknown function (DUF3592)